MIAARFRKLLMLERKSGPNPVQNIGWAEQAVLIDLIKFRFIPQFSPINIFSPGTKRIS
jgi:hypothetical protein